MSNRTPYGIRMVARVPNTVPTLIATAAARTFISPSAYIRQAVVEKLQRDGLAVPPVEIDAQQAA